jgi:hypothetical protein
MQRLSGLDTAFLYLETPTIHMTVQAVMLLDTSTVPGGYSFEKIKSHLQSRLPQLPEFRRRLAPVPFDLHRPVWFDDPDFDFDYHVRHVAVPSPGSAVGRPTRRRHRGRSLDRSPALGVLAIGGRRGRHGRDRPYAPLHDRRRLALRVSRRRSSTWADPVEMPVVDDFTPEHKPSDVGSCAAIISACGARYRSGSPSQCRRCAAQGDPRAPRPEHAVGRHAVQHPARRERRSHPTAAVFASVSLTR